MPKKFSPLPFTLTASIIISILFIHGVTNTGWLSHMTVLAETVLGEEANYPPPQSEQPFLKKSGRQNASKPPQATKVFCTPRPHHARLLASPFTRPTANLAARPSDAEPADPRSKASPPYAAMIGFLGQLFYTRIWREDGSNEMTIYLSPKNRTEEAI